MSSEKPNLDDLRIDRGASSPPRSYGAPALVLVSLLLLGGLGFWWSSRPKIAAVRTALVRESESLSNGQRTVLNASGYVTARRVATVSSKASGKVMEVLVEEGMKVEAGQVLARIDASNVEKSLQLAAAQHESARRALDETKANLERAERELRRITQLAADKLVSQSELDQIAAEAKSLNARLARQTADVTVAEREVDLWGQQKDDTIIRAPFSGVVISKNAQPGEMISPMSAGGGFTRTGICTIVDMGSLEIEVDVSESYINRVEPGGPVQATLDSYPDWRIPAKVIAIIPTADRQKATVKVRVGFEALDPRVLPDMGVKVAFQSGIESGEPPRAGRRLLVPKSAVLNRDGQSLVWIVRSGRVERRAVTVGTSVGDDITLASGVAGGDRVIVESPVALADGARVKEMEK